MKNFKIPARYRLHIVNPDDELLDTIDLEDWDLGKPMARAQLADDVRQEVYVDAKKKGLI